MSQAHIKNLKDFIEFKFKNANKCEKSSPKKDDQTTICICKQKINKTNLNRHLLIKHYYCNFCQEFHVPTTFVNCPVYNEVLKIIYD